MRIFNKEYDIGNKLNKKIVLISDLHYFYKKEINHLYKVLDEIIKINPDFVCISGDLIDSANINDEEYFIEFLTILSKHFITIAVLGNHEYYINKSKKQYGLNNSLIRKISNIRNLYLLDSKNKEFDDINFIGINFSIENYFDKEFISKDLDGCVKEGSYNILISHSPEKLDNILNNYNIDLVLSGHMHGGLVPKFLRKKLKGKGFVGPNGKLFPKFSYGIKKSGNTSIIVTSGIKVISHLSSISFLSNLFSSEIVIIKI